MNLQFGELGEVWEVVAKHLCGKEGRAVLPSQMLGHKGMRASGAEGTKRVVEGT